MSRSRKPPRLNRDSLPLAFDRGAWSRGVKLYDSGAVQMVGWSADEGELLALVQGGESKPYLLAIELHADDDVDAWCSCPVEENCKHAVAALLAFADDQASGRGASPRAPRRGAAEKRLDDWLNRFAAARDPAPAPLDRHGPDFGRLRGSHDTLWIYSLVPVRSVPVVHGAVSVGVAVSALKAKRGRHGLTKGRLQIAERDFHPMSTFDAPALDQDLLALLGNVVRRRHGWRTARDDQGIYAIDSAGGAAVLEMAVRTGRCFLGDDREAPLVRGPDLVPALDWSTGTRGVRTLSIALDGIDDWWLADTDPPRYVDVTGRRVGTLDIALTSAELALVLELPPVPDAHAQRFANALVSTMRTALPPPVESSVRTIDVDPTPVILVHSPSGDERVDAWRVSPYLRYGDALLPNDPRVQGAVELAIGPDGDEVRIVRREALQRRWHDEFHERLQGFVPAAHDDPGPDDDPDDGRGPPVDFVPAEADPSLRFGRFRELVARRESLAADGWELVALAPVHTDATRVSSFAAELDPDAENGWFTLGLKLRHEGTDYDLLPLVVDWLERGADPGPLYVPAADGTWLEVPEAVLEPVAATFRELGGEGGDGSAIRLSRTRALSLKTLADELDAAGVDTAWRGEKALFALGERLVALGEVDTSAFEAHPVPAGIDATLRPYQRAGLGWMQTLSTHGLNGILADDMGLGKTLQTIAHVVASRESGEITAPTLVVAPTSVLGNWAREVRRFAPGLRVRVWHGTERHDAPLEDDASEVIVTSYALALRDRAQLANHGFGLLVLDEAQQIKNPIAKITQALKALPIERRLCLTGTPLENHLGELWSQFDFLMPGLLGTRARFTSAFRTPIEKHGDAALQRRLASAVRPFLLRRKKEDVASDLPPKTEIVREVNLEGAQAQLYESIRVSMEARVRKLLERKGLAKSHVQMLDALLKLRQTCCHPALVKLPSARKVRTSAKTQLALDMIDELVGEGRKILLFSQFTGMLTLLEAGLKERGHDWVKLTGQTRKRDAVVDAFQHGDVPLFLVSLKAGGTGLNLTAADTVIHYDPWWNPAAENQASDRAHRIGQDKPVFVYKLVTVGTVEERIVAMQRRKRALSDATIERGSGEPIGKLSADDVLSLFAAG